MATTKEAVNQGAVFDFQDGGMKTPIRVVVIRVEGDTVTYHPEGGTGPASLSIDTFIQHATAMVRIKTKFDLLDALDKLRAEWGETAAGTTSDEILRDQIDEVLEAVRDKIEDLAG